MATWFQDCVKCSADKLREFWRSCEIGLGRLLLVLFTQEKARRERFMAQVIVVGGGLSGLSAAHSVLEKGGRVILLDKNGFLGGNSTKATSGINGALTRTQVRLGIKVNIFCQSFFWRD